MHLIVVFTCKGSQEESDVGWETAEICSSLNEDLASTDMSFAEPYIKKRRADCSLPDEGDGMTSYHWRKLALHKLYCISCENEPVNLFSCNVLCPDMDELTVGLTSLLWRNPTWTWRWAASLSAAPLKGEDTHYCLRTAFTRDVPSWSQGSGWIKLFIFYWSVSALKPDIYPDLVLCTLQKNIFFFSICLVF